MEFKKLMLKDVIKNIFSGGTPRTGNPEYWDGDLLWLSSGETRSRYITTTEKKITKKAVEESSTKLAKENSIVIASAGQGHTRGQTSFLLKPMYINQSVIAIEADPDIVLSKYLFYNISGRYRELRHISDSSSSRGSLTGKILKDLPIDVPPLKIQNNVVNFIDSVDKRIELNKKIIANLEELSQTLFKRWFVDFEFPDENRNPYKSYEGEFQYLKNLKLPLSWTINTIADNASGGIITGKTPSTKIKENYAPHGIPFITIPDMHKDVFVLNTERYISELGMSKLKNKILPKNSISVSCIATPGLVTITSKDSITNQQVNSFQPNKNKLYYLYFTLKRMKGYIRDLGSGGSATLNLNKSQFSKIEVVSPTDDILDNFNKLIEPNFHKILNLQKENMNLSHLRDTLLPKLMSGEIELPDELEVDEHAELLQ